MRPQAANVMRSSSATITFLWLEITEKCNLACSHCYAESTPLRPLEGRMTLENWIEVLDEAAAMGVRGIQFIGGEPTLHPHFGALLRHAASLGLDELEVYTNATRLNSAMLELIRSCGAKIATSFYAARADVHDEITSRSGSFERTMHGIRGVLAADIPLRIGIVETEANRGHVGEAISLLRGLGVERIGIDGERGVGRGAKSTPSAGEDFTQLCGQCWRSRACVTASGKIYPCVFSRQTVLGDAHAGLASALTSSTLARFTEVLRAEEASRVVRVECDPALPCSPQVCGPQLDCQPNRFCSPDNQCQPHIQLTTACDPSLPCGPQVCGPQLDCQPNRFCSPDNQCTPHINGFTASMPNSDALR